MILDRRSCERSVLSPQFMSTGQRGTWPVKLCSKTLLSPLITSSPQLMWGSRDVASSFHQKENQKTKWVRLKRVSVCAAGAEQVLGSGPGCTAPGSCLAFSFGCPRVCPWPLHLNAGSPPCGSLGVCFYSCKFFFLNEDNKYIPVV